MANLHWGDLMATDTLSPLNILVVAGEVSGDMHAAALIEALRVQSPRPVTCFGVGGDLMREAGVELLFHTDQTAVMGLWEVLKQLNFFRGMMRALEQAMDERKPDMVLTVDYPGFNLRLARRAHARGIQTVHYISPKVWVWNKARIPKMAACLDRLITIFPFEADCFKETLLPVSFAGHPLVDRARQTRASPGVALPWEAGHRIALLPGSRATEIQRLLPPMLETALLLEREQGKCSFVIPAPTGPAEGWVREIIERTEKLPASLHVVRGNSRHVLLQARATLVASGTATLEASLMDCPMVIVYRAAWITYLIGRLLVRGLTHVGLVNIIAGREVCRELIQHRFTPAAAMKELAAILNDGPARTDMLTAMTQVNAALGEGDTDVRAAAALLESIPQVSV